MLRGDLRTLGHAFRLKPEDELVAHLVTGVADRLQAVGKLLRVAKPVAHAVGESVQKPGGVEPMVIAADLMRGLGRGDLALLGAPVGPAPNVTIETLQCERKLQRATVQFWSVAEHQ